MPGPELLHVRAPRRVPGVRTAKTTFAAVLAFLVADALATSPQPVLAPLTALLVAQLTTYETVTTGITRIVSVLAGVLVAVALAPLGGLTWWTLGAAVGLCLVLGRLLRLGDNLLEVPISAMIVLAVGGSHAQAEGRVVETLIGAAVGVAVTVGVAPPLHVQPAADALSGLAERIAAVLRGLADELRGDWTRAGADRWLDEARALAVHAARADTVLARAVEGSRYNPRGQVARAAQPRLRTALSGMEHGYVALRSLCRALLDRTYFVPQEADAYSPAARHALADVLDGTADALGTVSAYTASETPDADARAELVERLRALRERRDRLSALLVVDPAHDEAAWQQHGALLASLDRLRVEVEAAMAPAEQPWQGRSAGPHPSLRRALVSPRRVLRAGSGAWVPSTSRTAVTRTSR